MSDLGFCDEFQSTDTMSLTKQNVTATYSGNQTCIPSTTVINSDGTVNSAALNSWVETLLTNTNAKPINSANPQFGGQENPAGDFASKSKVLRENIKKEYCFYYKRYIWAMQKILTDATNSSRPVDPVLKEAAQSLNTKLNTILLVMKALVNSRLNTLETYYGDRGVNRLNGDLDNARRNLKDHSEQLQKNDMNTDIQSSMIEYSLEKNSSSRNLLAIYGFMNLVALGLLFYLYKNTKE
jgi:hypothetical protein